MDASIRLMTSVIADILRESQPSIYLYGSVTMDDFRPGWSDVDLLALTRRPITPEQAERLLPLRQTLPKQYPELFFARSFEGGMLDIASFLKGYPTTVVYWGTSGQRIAERHHFDSFGLWELHHCGWLLHGEDVRDLLPFPTPSDLHTDVARHLDAILHHGCGGRSLYAFGWLLDIARGLYTLRHDAVIPKTAAGEWALAHGLCPDEAALRLALAVRRDPSLIQQPAVLAQAEALTPAIQSFAQVLSREMASVPDLEHSNAVHFPADHV